jgi:hypothetical protein
MKPKSEKQPLSSPNVALCRARRFGLTDVVFCLVPNGHNCGFAISVGQGVFCRHPDCEQIIAQTKAVLGN